MENELSPVVPSRRVLKYALNGRHHRTLLATHLKQAITVAFNDVHPSSKLRNELADLKEAIGLLAKERSGTLIVRQKDIQQSIYYFLELMEDIRFHSTQSTWPRKERKLSRALFKFTRKLNKQTNISLNRKESQLLEEINLRGERRVLYINLIRISPHFHSAFEGEEVA